MLNASKRKYMVCRKLKVKMVMQEMIKMITKMLELDKRWSNKPKRLVLMPPNLKSN